MADSKNYIEKIKFTDGSVYYVYDAEAPRTSDLDNYLPTTGGTITGNLTVDTMIAAGELVVERIEWQEEATDNVLIQTADGTIKKRSADNLLEDIGGCSYNIDPEAEELSFKVGKQTS